MLEHVEVPIMVVAADPDIFDNTVDEALLADEDSIEQNLRYEINSYGADYDVDGLVKRLNNGDIKIPAFQRGYVWPIKQAARFVESLLLGLPVPGIFLSKEPETNKLLVIDGQQRLSTLKAFYDGVFPTSKKEFSLVDVQPALTGKTYKTLEEEHRRVLDNAIIHATVVKQTNPLDGGSGIYKIFERLNSSGMLLSPQEIRTAIYSGSLSRLLAILNTDAKWRTLFGPSNKRMRDQELILRFFSLLQTEVSYERPMKNFLNDFMDRHKVIPEDKCNEMASIFLSSVELVHDAIGPKAFKPSGSFNAAVFDAMLVGAARRLSKGPVQDYQKFSKVFQEVSVKSDFQLWTSRSTADDETVKKRLRLTTEEFSLVA